MVPTKKIDTSVRDPEGKRLVSDCLAGDATARTRFHTEFGPLIYRFLEYVRDAKRAEAGDFYLYVFDDDRVYRRLRSYQGRASLGPYLRGFVLPDLFRQFQEMTKKRALDTVSLDDEGDLAAATPPETVHDPAAGLGGCSTARAGDLLSRLSAEKRMLVKLLYIEDFELEAGDIQLLAERSTRPVREVLELIEQARDSVRAREMAHRRHLDEAESAAQWILRYERQLAAVAGDLGSVPTESTRAERLREQQAELERKRLWRQRQRDRTLAESQRATVTLRYREIARILNAPVGSVSAQVTRLRQELLNLAAGQASGRGRDV